jgi:hypothetical protein
MRSVVRWVAMIVALLVPVAVSAQGDGEKCSTFDELVSMDNVSTVSQLKFNALMSARNRLLQTLGVEVRGTTEVLRGGTRDSSYIVMTQGISQETTGWITSDTVLDWRTDNAARSFTMKYRGCARTSMGKRDPAFFAEVSLDKDPAAYVDNGPDRRDSIVVFTKVSQPAYVSVFFRTGDTLTVLYPSMLVGAPTRTHLGTGGEMRVPPAGNRLRTRLTGNARKSTDWIVVVATKQDVPFSMDGEPQGSALRTMSWREYMQWLNRIPLEERFVVEKPFTIERTR